jgi:hypothetical protein
MGSVRPLTFLLLTIALSAQDRPQLTWQGKVDGIALITIRGDRLDNRVQEGAPVEAQQFRFSAALPEVRQDARVQVVEGRGYVHIVEQPRLENRYTLSIAIEDRQPGSSSYSIAVYWDASNRFFESRRPQGRTDQVTWSGRVDEETMVSCQAKTCVSKSARGAPAADERVRFSRPLPARDVDVALELREGRGDIRLVEQPRETNHYTARVAIHDRQGGTGEYAFTLVWPRASGKTQATLSPQRGFTWSGMVDGRVRVTMRGGGSFSEVIEGGPVQGERAEFIRTFPGRSDVRPIVRKVRGRGRIDIVEYPSDGNSYQFVFEINDPEAGADNYEVEVAW